ncbi:hypothetical protein EJB05_34226 [Eragrostis curvula]|uniref:Uncharacterized protein n=1 Tax=Eragrostis curvula TaxID=38414 RepID=A0A5J9U344_9POAL|nr:hypothetical protein EJB05_34226 [Eragrostis curvula]
MAARLPSLSLRRTALELEDAGLPWGSDAVRYSPEDLLPKNARLPPWFSCTKQSYGTTPLNMD